MLNFEFLLANVCIAIASFPGCDVINFDNIFLMKPLFCMTKKNSRQQFKYENKTSF